MLGKATRNGLDPGDFKHIVRVERPGDRPVTNVTVDGALWASVSDEMLLERVGGDSLKIGQWAENVVRNLLQYMKDGVDIWADKLADAKFDFLMRCAP